MNPNLISIWEKKRTLAMIVSIIVAVGIVVFNVVTDAMIDVNFIFLLLGLNVFYIFRQGSVESRKTGEHVLKAFWESKKFWAMLIGNIAPIALAIINMKYDTGITPVMLYSLLGIDAAYIGVQAQLDIKNPDAH